MNVWEAVSDGLGKHQGRHLDRQYPRLRRQVRFVGQDQQKKVGVLSGGERNRVHLARMLKSGANVILLDEPTNDLDVNTIRSLEEALKTSAAVPSSSATTAYFLDRLATHILPPSKGGLPGRLLRRQLPGLRADKHKRLGTEADKPHRIKYRS